MMQDISQADSLAARVSLHFHSHCHSLIQPQGKARSTAWCARLAARILEYVNSQEKLEEVLADLKRLSQIAITQNPLVNAIDRNRPNMQLMSVMEEYKGRQAGAHFKLEEEVKRIQKIDPDMVATLRDNVAAIGLLDMFQN